MRRRLERHLTLTLQPLWQAGRALLAGSRPHALARLLVLAGAVGLAALLYMWSGIIPIAASSGHWPATRWLLQFAMRNAVQTHATGIKAPALDGPALVLKGAGHYATGCAPCHGAPGQQRSVIAHQMTPKAPFLPSTVHEWQAKELFWIVRHGIKFTAMPAWPARQREDEVWAMVAFLRQLPELSPKRYDQLAYGEGADAHAAATPEHRRSPTQPLLANCARCHGADGAGRGAAAFPKLAGQREAYLLGSLRAFAEGTRHSGIMRPVSAGLDEARMRALARHYAKLPVPQPETTGAPAPDTVARGRAIAEQGVPEKGIPACTECHGPAQTPRNPAYPRLAGQYRDYLALQLHLFKADQRGGTPYAHIMRAVAKRLDREQIRDVTAYYASLDPSKQARPPRQSRRNDGQGAEESRR